jgi:hypothetical protein
LTKRVGLHFGWFFSQNHLITLSLSSCSTHSQASDWIHRLWQKRGETSFGVTIFSAQKKTTYQKGFKRTNFLLKWLSVIFPSLRQCCQISFATMYQNGENIPNNHKYIKWPLNIPNGRKMDLMATKYTYTFNCKTLQDLPKLGFLVWKSGKPALRPRGIWTGLSIV